MFRTSSSPGLAVVLVALSLLCPCLFGCAWLGKTEDNPSIQAQSLLEQAQQAEEAGQLEQAGILLHRAIEADPADAEARRALARLLLEQQSVDAALDQLRIAVTQNPDDVDSIIQLAGIQLDHGRYEGAEEEIQRALQVDPDHVEALQLKAKLAAGRGRDALALETYHRVLAREPDKILAHLSVAEIQLAAGRPRRAAPLLRTVCQSKAATPEQKSLARWQLGIAYGQQGRWGDSARSLRAAIPQRHHMTADDWYRLAFARYADGDMIGARSDAAMALRLRPDHRQALAMTGALEPTLVERRPSLPPVSRTAMVVPTPAGW